jgi:hypothetical protein
MVINLILYFVFKRSYILSSNGHQPNNIVAYIFIHLNPILFPKFILYFFSRVAHNFFKGCYSLRKMLLDDSDDDLEVIGAVKEELSLRHCATQR